MISHQPETLTLPSKQPKLNAIYGLSRFCGFYVNGSLKMTHFTAKNDKVKLTHP